jgi:hypothetical protein
LTFDTFTLSSFNLELILENTVSTVCDNCCKALKGEGLVREGERKRI